MPPGLPGMPLFATPSKPVLPPSARTPFDDRSNSRPETSAKRSAKHAPAETARAFARRREAAALALYGEFNRRAFDGQLPAAVAGEAKKSNEPDSQGRLVLQWSKTLNTTAGTTRLMRRGQLYYASIQLSVKVLDSEEKCARAARGGKACPWVLTRAGCATHCAMRCATRRRGW